MKDKLIWIGPVAAAATAAIASQAGMAAPAVATLGVTVLCAIWWIGEALPIPVTSLLPMTLLPLMNVITPSDVAAAYGHPLILLLLGGFLLSTAMEYSGVHRRLALSMIRVVGAHSDRHIVIGFMLAAALLSMWISNTATTLMLLPIALAIISSSNSDRLAVPLLLGLAYSASLGGIGTPIGTPPNVIFMGAYEEATGQTIGFLDWMMWALPVVFIFLFFMILWLTRGLKGSSEVEIPRVGAWLPIERRVLLVFALTALAWVTRSQPFGGWQAMLDIPNANDAAVALLAVVVMFIIPDGRGGRLLTWEAANKIPWGVLLLFAGGITLAKGFTASGLAANIGEALSAFTVLPLFALLLCITLGVTFLTEVTSNTATTALLMPILAAAAASAGLPAELLMVPAAMSASCAFMLPVATAPNAIIYGNEAITVSRMAREGVILNLIGALVISGCMWLLLPH
ncbi:SLC13 family permease [Biformimicrobium ophioploci]|uniref:SLC13 family permease n=1 Tax=Biformimicrobium ophioploci TaxID=3036711 RepID=A0ABQ6M2P0_9GAMM|nr:SLC13 family permease [Microbulbifer sp. NKW57]GMG88535.1 SLC13 family permease [Microbulbifer sp. NKW57]